MHQLNFLGKTNSVKKTLLGVVGVGMGGWIAILYQVASVVTFLDLNSKIARCMNYVFGDKMQVTGCVTWWVLLISLFWKIFQNKDPIANTINLEKLSGLCLT